jgi:hypothetical protein
MHELGPPFGRLPAVNATSNVDHQRLRSTSKASYILGWILRT